MREREHGQHSRGRSGDQRVLRTAVAFGAAAALGAGVVPMARAAPAHSSSSVVSTASPRASVVDPDAEKAALELLKATYFNDVDTKDWLALRHLVAPDAVVDTTGSLGPYFPNRDSFIAFTSITLSAINTRHQGYDPQIDLTSATAASAVWTMQDRLSLAGLVTIHGFGHYTDSYERVDGQWLISSSKLTRTGFTLEFPALRDFAAGIVKAYKAGGPVGALFYVVPGMVDIAVNAIEALTGAIGSNFGGAPTKAEPIAVPPGSTGVTSEPPGITTTLSATTASSAILEQRRLRSHPVPEKASSAIDSVGFTSTPAGRGATTRPVEGKSRTDSVEAPKTLDDNASAPASNTVADAGDGLGTTTTGDRHGKPGGSTSLTSPDSVSHSRHEGAKHAGTNRIAAPRSC